MSRTPKFKLQEIYIHFGMFDFAVNVAICKNAHEVYRYAAWKFEEKNPDKLHEIYAEGRARGTIFIKYGYCPIIWIPRFPVTAREHGTLAHEAGHAVKELMKWANIAHLEDTDEVYCHAIGFLVTKILEAKNNIRVGER